MIERVKSPHNTLKCFRCFIYLWVGGGSLFQVFQVFQILLAKSKSGERRDKIGLFSPLGGEHESSFVLERKRTSLQKSTSPAVSVSGVSGTENDAPRNQQLEVDERCN